VRLRAWGRGNLSGTKALRILAEELRLLRLEFGVRDDALALEVGKLGQLVGCPAAPGGLLHVIAERLILLAHVRRSVLGHLPAAGEPSNSRLVRMRTSGSPQATGPVSHPPVSQLPSAYVAALA
jgi:hypothetical protein